MKASLAVLLVLGIILMLFLARRRLWLALKLTAAAFVALNVFRLTQIQDSSQGFLTVGLAIGIEHYDRQSRDALKGVSAGASRTTSWRDECSRPAKRAQCGFQ